MASKINNFDCLCQKYDCIICNPGHLTVELNKTKLSHIVVDDDGFWQNSFSSWSDCTNSKSNSTSNFEFGSNQNVRSVSK